MKTLRQYISGFWKVYCREFHLVAHDVGLLLFFLFLPLAYPIIYSLIYNPEVVRDVRMVVVDHDRTPLSRDLVRKIDACQEAWVTGYATDLNEARHAVSDHDAYAILEIPSGFQRAVGRNEQANVVMYCEMSLMLRYRGFLVAATNVMQEMGGEITTHRINTLAPLATTVTDGGILGVDNISMGNIENGFDSFIMPGVIVLILHQCIILACGMAGGAKREKALKVGYNPADDTAQSVAVTMLGQMLCYITILILPALFLLHYVPLIFSFPMAGNLGDILIFITPMVIACMGLGFMLQGIVREREDIFVIWVVTSVMLLFLSGLTWPRYAITGFWRVLSDILPATWGVEGFIRINTNGGDLMQEREAFLNLWILAAAYLIGAYLVQKFVIRKDLTRLSDRS